MNEPTAAASECQWVYLTAPSREVAERLGRLAVERRLAACANVGPPIVSVYRWRGSVETAQEVAVVLKTTVRCVSELVQLLATEHPYECPCIEVLPVVAGHSAFLAWVAQETGPEDTAALNEGLEPHRM